jgi:hypothetical protein
MFKANTELKKKKTKEGSKTVFTDYGRTEKNRISCPPTYEKIYGSQKIRKNFLLTHELCDVYCVG